MSSSISNYINDFIQYKSNVDNLRPRSSEAYQHDLQNSFLPFLSKRGINLISEIKERDVEDFLTFIKQKSKSGSVSNRNRKLASIQSFYKFLKKKRIARNIITEIKPLKARAKVISYLTDIEKDHLLETVENSSTPFYKFRDIAIFKLFLCTGIRVSELTNLQIQDVELHSKGMSYIHISRKGGNEVQLPINSKAVYAIKMYFSKRKDITPATPAFTSKNNKKLEPNSIYHLVKHYLQEAEISKRKWGPHILRHTVGVSLRRRGIDIATIQNLLGHKNLETTAIYLNVEPQDLEKAVQLL